MNALVQRYRDLSRMSRFVVLAVIGVLVLSLAEALSPGEGITGSGAASAALRVSIPILLAGLGGLFSERAGVVNIGLEGMMIAGTWFSAWGAWQFGPWTGVLVGIVGGALFGLIHAVATVTFNVDHIVSGVAINILGLGGMRFLSSALYTQETGGSVLKSPQVDGTTAVDLPFLAGGNLFGWESPDFFGWLEDLDIFFISDVGGILGGFTRNVNWLAVIALALVPLTVWVLWRTPWGLRLRSCGEDPWAAESLGVRVLRMKYWAVITSGALAGLGGAFLVLVQTGIYREGGTAGRGFIGLAALIFGNWMPAGVLSGSLVFGLGDSLRFRGPEVVRSLILAIAIGLMLFALVNAVRRAGIRRTTMLAAAGVGFLLFYLLVEDVPNQFLSATPYVVTLLVLAAASQRLRMPAADGARYVKGEAH